MMKMTTEQLFDSMTRTKRVCEVCHSYLCFNGEDGCHYCPECDWDYVSQFAGHEAQTYPNNGQQSGETEEVASQQKEKRSISSEIAARIKKGNAKTFGKRRLAFAGCFLFVCFFQIFSKISLRRLSNPLPSPPIPPKMPGNKGISGIFEGETPKSKKPCGLALRSRKNMKFGTPWNSPCQSTR
jgi:uncharacterized Zn finger protein (UPF0148 family)